MACGFPDASFSLVLVQELLLPKASQAPWEEELHPQGSKGGNWVYTGLESGAENGNPALNLARGRGMQLMQGDALVKVESGMTTFEEILRAVPFEPVAPQQCRNCQKVLTPAFLFCPYCACGAGQRESSVSNCRLSITPAGGTS